MQFIATSDVHGNKKNLEPFTQTLEKAFKEAKKHKCPLYIGGDLNDTKATLRSEFIGVICDLFYKYKSIKKYILVGNHDMNNHHNHEEHSLEFMKSLPNTTVIDTPGVIMEEWYAIPYRHTNAEILKELQIAKDMGAKKLLLHQGVMGAKQSEYILDESSICLEDLKDFEVVLTGHYHSHQTLGNVTYFGSPFTVSFAEANQDKFIWLVTDDQGKVELDPIETGCRKHVQFEWMDKIPKTKPKGLKKDSIVKVILKGTKEFCLGTTKEEIQKLLKVDSVSVVPEIISQSARRIEAHQIHKPLEVIGDYLEQATTSLDKGELKEYLQGITNANTQS